jgi:L-asparaginase
MPGGAKITIFFTGGTISMTRASIDGSAVPTLTGSDICRVIPSLGEFELTNVDFGKLPGPHMTQDRMLALSQQVEQACAGGCDGVVVTHGTDTMEETAYLLDLLHHHATPVVLVGAMRTSDDLSWDGPINLFGACLVASHPEARGRGVMVVMNNTIHAASEVTKTYTEALDTFVSPDTGPLGIIDLHRVYFYRPPVRRMLLPEDTARCERVELVEACAGGDGLLVEAAAQKARGLVVAAMGRGNIPPPMFDAVVAAIHRGIVVVVVSRCWGGRVAPVYGYAGAGARLVEAGAMFAPWLNGPKARIGLGAALGAALKPAALRTFFESEHPAI